MVGSTCDGPPNHADETRTFLTANRQDVSKDSGLEATVAAEPLPVVGARRGGPKTPEGKAVSRVNAVKHGLSASTVLPDILGHDLVEHHYEALHHEWQPSTPTEEFLVRDMARHQAALARIEQIELAVLRRGACNPLNLGAELDADDQLRDTILAAAGTSDAIERISRYRRQHERAFLHDLAVLREARRMALSHSGRSSVRGRAMFSSEEACTAYLAKRARELGFVCPKCNGRAAKWLATRSVWQCCACRRQVGIRTGTVFEGSRVGLLPWFRAIESVLANPRIATAELAVATGVGRQATLGKMVKKIHRAMNSPDRTRLLAGLDGLFGTGGPRPAEISGTTEPFVQNELVAFRDEEQEEKDGKI